MNRPDFDRFGGTSRSSGDWWPAVVGAAFFAIVVVLTAAGVWAISNKYTPPPAPAFLSGQMVQMRAFGTTGMVVSVHCREGVRGEYDGYCTYAVRFDGTQASTDTRWIGQDGPITVAPVALVKGIQEFELQPARVTP